MGAILLNRKLERVAAFESLVKPQNIDLMYEKSNTNNKSAFQVHGIDEKDLKEAPCLHDVISKLDKIVYSYDSNLDPKQIVLFGANVQFDLSFLKVAYEKLSKKWPYDYHILDLPSLYTFWYIKKHNKLPEELTLKSMCNETGVSNDQPHSAMEDIATSVGILRHITGEIKE